MTIDLLTFARTILRARRLRSRFLPGDLFQEPAWDMLLDLLSSDLEGKRLSTTSLCRAGQVAVTTGLRWIGHLEDAGLVARQADAADGRRVYVDLTERGRDAMLAYVRSSLAMLADESDACLERERDHLRQCICDGVEAVRVMQERLLALQALPGAAL